MQTLKTYGGQDDLDISQKLFSGLISWILIYYLAYFIENFQKNDEMK